MINIIHLPERTDRAISVAREMASQDIHVSQYKLWLGIRSQFVFNGIREAHQQIVRDAKNRSLPSVTIAEDDIKFLGPGAWRYYQNRFPLDYDIYFGGIFDGEVNANNDIVNGDFSGMTLYTVNSRFYDTFLQVRQAGHLDRILKGLGRYVVCTPMIVSQHEGWSDNHKKVVTGYDERLEKHNLYK